MSKVESLSISAAVANRRSIRQFLDKPVSREDVVEILEQAKRAPSGGNLQPWKVYVLAGEVRDRLVNTVAKKSATNPAGEGSEYAIYPPDLKDPYRTRRREVGSDLYELIGIPREDKMAKFAQLAKNFEFFGAPVGLIFTIDRQMGLGQWADLGMFMQNVMLLAKEKGLDTCPQEAWAVWYKTIAEIAEIPDEEVVFCGMCMGYADQSAVINQLVSKRAELAEFAILKGF